MPQQASDTSAWTPVDESTSAWTPVDEPTPQQPSALYRGVKGVGEGFLAGVTALPAIASMATNPAQAITQGVGTIVNAQQTKNKAGRVAQDVASMVPVVGPGLAQQGQMVAQGNIAEPVGQFIGAMAAPLASPKYVVGPAMERMGAAAQAPLDVHLPWGIKATPANIAGGGAGAWLGGHLPGHPYVGEVLGATLGAGVANKIADLMQQGGVALQRLGGDIVIRIPKEAQEAYANRGGVLPVGAPKPSPEQAAAEDYANRSGFLRTPKGKPTAEEAASKAYAQRSRRGFLPVNPPPGASPEQAAAGVQTPGRSIILPGESIDPLKVRGAGSAAQATEEDLQRLAAVGDQSAVVELTRRRIPVRGAPRSYSKVPLPKGREVQPPPK